MARSIWKPFVTPTVTAYGWPHSRCRFILPLDSRDRNACESVDYAHVTVPDNRPARVAVVFLECTNTREYKRWLRDGGRDWRRCPDMCAAPPAPITRPRGYGGGDIEHVGVGIRPPGADERCDPGTCRAEVE